MTPDLDAVRTEIWPGWMRDSKITALCPCQYGLCGACRQGRHDRCLTTQLGGPALDDVYGYVVTRGSIVVATILWPDDQTPCAYRCPCPEQHTTPTPRPRQQRPTADVPLPEPDQPDQPVLF